MRKINLILLISLLAFFAGCNEETFKEHEIGDNFIDESTEVRLIDTFTINSSTVKVDSLLTSGQSKVLFGLYKDEFFGDISSDFYSPLGLGEPFALRTVSSNNDNKVPIKFDSLVFICYTDRQYYGDTLPEQTISIHRVIEEIEIPDDQVGFYSHSSFNFDPIPLGTASFDADPIRNSIYEQEKEFVSFDNDEYIDFNDGGIRIRMDDALGLEIVEKVNVEDDTVLIADKWNKYFNGIVLKAGVDNSTMLTLDLKEAEMKMRLYYSYADYDINGKRNVHDFPINASILSFINYKSDKSSTPQDLGRIVEQTEDLSSVETDDLAFIQGGTGLLTKIKIPYLENLNTIGFTGGVLKAELIFYPKDNSYDDDIIKLPSQQITVYETDENNQILAQLPGTTANSGASSIYMFNPENRDESYYSIDITSYVNTKLLNGLDFEDGLMITLPFETIGASMDRLVIENDPKSDFRIQLRTTYVVQN